MPKPYYKPCGELDICKELTKKRQELSLEREDTHLQSKADLMIRSDSENLLSVDCAGEPIGQIELYSNRFHAQNQYLKLHLSRYENAWAAPLFSMLQETAKKPLQVMLSSEDTQQVKFLLAGGFECKRKCYEVEVTPKDYCGSGAATPLETAQRGQPEYAACCQLLYDYYKATHAGVNPLTADTTSFCEELPEDVFYARSGEQIQHFAFVEENEIAYVGSLDTDKIPPFVEAVVSTLFAKYEAVCFEYDDCDTAAMALKDLFCIDVEESYDTYVRE